MKALWYEVPGEKHLIEIWQVAGRDYPAQILDEGHKRCNQTCTRDSQESLQKADSWIDEPVLRWQISRETENPHQNQDNDGRLDQIPKNLGKSEDSLMKWQLKNQTYPHQNRLPGVHDAFGKPEPMHDAVPRERLHSHRHHA